MPGRTIGLISANRFVFPRHNYFEPEIDNPPINESILNKGPLFTGFYFVQLGQTEN